MKGALGDMMRKAQQMQAEMEKQQEALKTLEVVGESGAGMVQVTLTGQNEARNVKIDSAAADGLSADDREMLEDLIAAAINDAVQKVQKETQGQMADLTAGMQLPPGFKMPL